jgi:hypothetical protein
LWLTLLFRNRNKLQIDLGDLKEEMERLSSYLHLNFKIDMTSSKNKLSVDSEKISAQDLQKAVNKFIYRRNLNSTHWVSLEDRVIRIKKFQNKKKEQKVNKNPVPPKFSHGF